MAHCIVPEAEEILDKEFPVLNAGFVRLVDYMGGDSRIVQSARVSYGDGTKTVREDGALIDYLLRLIYLIFHSRILNHLNYLIQLYLIQLLLIQDFLILLIFSFLED